MPRELDPFWKYVERGESDTWKCQFCSNKYGGSATRIRAHLAGIPRYGIKGCEKVDPHVRAEALQKIEGRGSMLDISTGGTSGEGTERIVFGTSQLVFQSDDVSNPNDTRNTNQPGSALQQPAHYWSTGTGTASACPQDQVSLPPGDMPLGNLDTTRQPDLLDHRLDAAHEKEIASPVQQFLMDLPVLSSPEPNELPAPLERPTHLESGGQQQSSRGLSSFPRYCIKGCEKVDPHVRAEALQKIEGRGSMLDISTGGTSGEGTERIVFGTSQLVFQSDDVSNPNDTRNTNQPGCAVQQLARYWSTGTGTASACPQDQVSLPPGDTPLGNLDATRQPDLLDHRLDAAHEKEIASPVQQFLMDLPVLSSPEPNELPAPLERPTHLESGGEQQSSRGLSSFPRYCIKGCEKVDHHVRVEALQKIDGKGMLDISTGGTSGEGRERTVFCASQIAFRSDDVSNPHDTQNSNQPGCAPQQPSRHWSTKTGTASACPQYQVSLPCGDMPLDNLDATRQPDLLDHRLDAAHENEIASSVQQILMDLPVLSSPDPNELPVPLEQPTHLESGREQQSSRGLSSLPRYGIKGCEKVDHHVRVEALQKIEGKSSMLDISTGGTSGEGMERNFFCAGQIGFQSNNASNPNDTQNLNRPWCELRQRVSYRSTRTGTASACPHDQVSLPPGDMPLDDLDTTQQPDLLDHRLDKAHGNETASSVQQFLMDLPVLSSPDPNELPAPLERPTHLESGREQQTSRGLSSFPNDQVLGNSMSNGLQEFIGDGITPDPPLFSTGWSNLRHSLPENLLESRDVIANRMPRELGRFREYVEYVENYKWKCRFCGKKYRGSATRIQAHLAGLRRYGITVCEKVDQHVRAEVLQKFNGKGSMLEISTGGTSGEGTERIVSGASQIAFQSDDVSNPHDTQSSNQSGCAPQQLSWYWSTETGTASACPRYQASLPSGQSKKDKLRTKMAKMEEKREVATIGKYVGTDDQVGHIMGLMNIEGGDKQKIVVIHGEAGIGKTTLAKLVYNHVSGNFDGCCFLADITETTQELGGLHFLQTKLISDVLKRECEDVALARMGIEFFRDLFLYMRALIVLDDVENAFHVKKLIGDGFGCFGYGSTILITTTNNALLEEFPQIWAYHVSRLDKNQALQLLRQHASIPTSREILYTALNAMAGLPLSIEVIGAVLNGTPRERLSQLSMEPMFRQQNLHPFLEKVYQTLDYKQKQIFLDIACFTSGKCSRIAWYLWYDTSCLPSSEILTPLAKIGENNQIWMHSLLRQFGKEIVAMENLTDPGKRSRLFNQEIALDMIKRKKGTEKVEALCLSFHGHTSNKLTPKNFESMPNLRFLQLDHADIAGDFANLFPNLRWLRWRGCPRRLQVTNFQLGNLTILDLSWTKVTEDWKGWDQIEMKNLRVLDLTGCADLLLTPKFSGYKNLAILILEQCSRLVKIDRSISDLQHLVTLNLKFCTGLYMLPVQVGHLTALKELFMDGTSIQEIPISIGFLKQLETLTASNCCSLTQLPRTICHLTNISLLSLDGTGIIALPDSIGELIRLKHLSLRDCHRLRKLPNPIGNIGRSLVELDVSGTGVSKFPDSLKNLQNLKVLRMDYCFFRKFPPIIGKLTSLEEIHASSCRSLEGEILSEIKKLHNLRILRLRHSSISSIPMEIHQLSNLHTLDLLYCDMIKELPRLPSSIKVFYVDDELKSSHLLDSPLHSID